MSHKSEHVSTKNGYWVKNGATRTQVITQAGVIKGDIKESLAQGSVYIGDAAGITSELSAKGDGKILVGNGTTATSVSVSGDATLANTGALTIGTDKITTTKILAANVTLAKLAAGITPSHVVKFARLGAGITTTALAGLVVDDLVIRITTAGACTCKPVATADTLPDDPADADYIVVLRATA